MARTTTLVFDQVPGKRRAPRWARTCFFDEVGELFVPAAIAGSEMGVILVAGYDGIGLMASEEHIYAPVSWLISVYPKLASELVAFRERALVFMVENPPMDREGV